MKYGSKRSARPFSEKGWNRKALAPWDQRWHALSSEARRLFLDLIGQGGSQTGIRLEGPPDAPRPPAWNELEAQGFVVVTPHPAGSLGPRVAPSPRARDFTLRMRAIQEHRLLTSEQPTGLVPYVWAAYYLAEGAEQLGAVLRKARIDGTRPLEEIVQRWVTRRYWPEWAAAFVKSPLQDRILDVLRAAGGPVPLAELPGHLPDAQREEVRAAVDQMVAYLILFEDLRPRTLELVVDFLPIVRSALPASSRHRERPPLVVCEDPEEVATEGGTVVNDLRAILLEVASEPPRLRRDGSLFGKEETRFLELLEPQPAWLTSDWGRQTLDERFNAAVRLGYRLGLARSSSEQGESRMHVTGAGQQWLGGGLEAQYVSVYSTFNVRSERRVAVAFYGSLDAAFLGSSVAVGSAKGRSKNAYSQGVLFPTEADIAALRAALLRAFETLPLGVYHRLDSVLDHFSFDGESPFNLGQPPGSVDIAWANQIVPDFPDEREEVGRRALEHLIRNRLVPLGALRLARAAGSALCVARTPLLAAYFGRPGLKLDKGAAPGGDTRVVVQPDFSVIIIGLNQAPVAALAPFCTRVPGQTGTGAVVFKLTRDSVLKAFRLGLSANEIIGRLKTHASNGLPANVERAVSDWCAWFRSVDVATLTVLRCDDRATADRVLSALGKRAERLNDTLVGLAADRLASAERAKLESQGILVRGATATHAKPAKRKRRRSDDDT